MDVAENDPEADWEPYYLTAEYQEKDNVYASFRDNKYVVVRKGYEHPEIVMKIISVLFDYSRFEDEENADEINSYFCFECGPYSQTQHHKLKEKIGKESVRRFLSLC